ncbi:leucine-rich repeat extensin-like protein 3 [Iris pallida]|uniref:Leucine-rich repeat extensin-like protein 3 n=1 Tax=Iris pallida TaxID=29817 RepID=A0AAX6FTE7_IRIPA|nr:leucine-rich repeat extensin-like protein 3 [Iris pallida]
MEKGKGNAHLASIDGEDGALRSSAIEGGAQARKPGGGRGDMAGVGGAQRVGRGGSARRGTRGGEEQRQEAALRGSRGGGGRLVRRGRPSRRRTAGKVRVTASGRRARVQAALDPAARSSPAEPDSPGLVHTERGFLRRSSSSGWRCPREDASPALVVDSGGGESLRSPEGRRWMGSRLESRISVEAQRSVRHGERLGSGLEGRWHWRRLAGRSMSVPGAGRRSSAAQDV